jgi:hypothetical protein
MSNKHSEENAPKKKPQSDDAHRGVVYKHRREKAIDNEESSNRKPGEELLKTKYPTLPNKHSQSEQTQKIIKSTAEEPTTKKQLSLKTSKPAGENIDAVDGAKENLLWNRELALPGPSLKKTHSIDTISHESNVTSTILESSPNDQREPGTARREAWPEYRPAHALVVPPYGISSSSATLIGSDSRSDISLSETEPFGEEIGITSPKEHVRPTIPSATRRLFTGRRQDFNDNRRKIDSFSSDDETSIHSYSSKASDVLSTEAMDKRRAIASQTLQRARRRQAQL